MQIFLAFLIWDAALIIITIMFLHKNIFVQKTGMWENIKLGMKASLVLPTAFWVVKKKYGYAQCMPALVIATIALAGIAFIFVIFGFDWIDFGTFTMILVLWILMNIDISLDINLH